jgi:phosphopantothenoylcysteine decarboxylase / phosphopantothenate---cysteine ligase
MLQGRKIVLGVTGSIAAYKAAVLTRLLVKAEAEVKVIMTPSAHDFITPLTLSTLSKNPVYTAFTDGDTGLWHNHVDLGLWADAVVIAPASANTLSAMAQGSCANLLLAVYLSARCPVLFAPAMDVDMLNHPATQDNISRLTRYGNYLIEPRVGELASGLVGNGRMAEPEEIVHFLEKFFSEKKKLTGKRALVTAGPTREAIDPVRFISNHSSGKMGFAIAEELATRGASVELVAGPTSQIAKHPNIHVTPVTSSEEMFGACAGFFPDCAITVLSAAVADFRPVSVAPQKIKKGTASPVIELTKTKDIALELGKLKKPGQVVAGFALETENETENAVKKLISKNFDLIVLNSLNDKGAGFGFETNKISIINVKNEIREFTLKNKKDVAVDIVNAIIEIPHA